MIRKFKTVKVLLASMACLLVATYVEAAPTANIALIMKSLSNPFFSAMADGAKMHAKQNATQYNLLVRN
jgi:ABC-type sugar transport system substrate-binding protein